jgi:hypothetical protein
MVQILVKVFLTDATVNSQNLAIKYNKRDSIDYYYNIYSPMGYRAEQFDKSIDYYVNNPKELDRILDKVINELARIETEVGAELAAQQQKLTEKNQLNLWSQKKVWELPRNGKQGTIDFKTELVGDGEYVLTAEVTVFPDDGSLCPALEMWFYYDDGTDEGARIGKKTEYYTKDGQTRTVTLTIALSDTLSTHVMGSLMSHQPRKGEWQKRATVKNISLAYYPLPSTNRTPIIPSSEETNPEGHQEKEEVKIDEKPNVKIDKRIMEPR